VDASELAKFGFEISAAMLLRRFNGVSTLDMLRTIEGETGLKLPDDFEARRDGLVDQAYRKRLKPIVGVEAALHGLATSKCVASNAQQNRLVEALQISGLHDLFYPHIFSADMVPRPKPHPDLFLYAARQMRVSANRCIVIEDSVAGVQAAKSAGMTVLGFSGGAHCLPDHTTQLQSAGAVAVFDDMVRLSDLTGQNISS
jgi:HAD superfamily hydrolase (TIGR01509 family)